MLVTNAGARTSVLIARKEVPAGARITEADLGQARVSLDPVVPAIPADQRSQVVGQVAKVGLLPGSLVTRGHLSRERTIPPGRSIVAVPLKAGQAPRVEPGDEVLVVPTGGDGSGPDDRGGGRVLISGGPGAARAALVQGVESSEAGDVIVSLLVDESAAPAIAAAASSGDISLALRSSSR